jgi:serine/threonine-protein kinase
VTHRNVARTFDIGEHEGDRFLTMELIAGEMLGAYLARRGTVPVRTVISIARDVCAGLAAAHAADVLHRDLKPENVILALDGRAVITDFGIARALAHAEAARTAPGLVGTPAYMAPEQVEGVTDLDARADLYALGVMLFEACTGRPPFRADSSYAMAAARLTEDAPDPASIRPELPPAVAAVIRGCLEREPRDRTSSARSLMEGLRAALESLPAEPETQPTLLSASAPRPSPIASPSSRASQPSQPSPSAPLPPLPPMTTPTGVKTVAVLPFTAEEADLYLADGLTEDLIDQLSMTPGLRVRPRAAVHRMRGPDRDPQALGRELGVTFVVEGSVRRRPEGLRVSARVVAVADGFQSWARRFDVADVSALLDPLAAAVADALTVRSPPQARRLPTGPEALDLYFRARHEYHRLDTAGVLRSVELFDQALALAPEDPTILTGNALARVRQWFFGAYGSGEQAEDAALRAIAAAPERGEPKVALSAVRFQQGRPAEAVRMLREALARSPALAEAHELLGRILAETGPFELALGHLQTAARLDPSLTHALWTKARLYALAGRWAEAEAIVDRTARESSAPGGWLYVARLAGWRGDAERARRVLEEPALQRPEHETALRMLRGVAAGGLDVDELFDATASGRHASSRSGVFVHQVRAELLAREGRVDAALEDLGLSVAGGLIDVVWVDRCPLLAPLREAPGFAEARAVVETRAAEVRAALGGVAR